MRIIENLLGLRSFKLYWMKVYHNSDTVLFKTPMKTVTRKNRREWRRMSPLMFWLNFCPGYLRMRIDCIIDSWSTRKA